mgnify:CR=1 FL=1
MQIKVEERDFIPLKLEIGKKYGLSWAQPGAVWVLKGIGSRGDVEMETPSTKRKLMAKAIDVRHTTQDAILKAKNRLNINP